MASATNQPGISATWVSVTALDDDLDGTTFSGLGDLEGVKGRLELEAVRHQRPHVHLPRGDHGQGDRVTARQSRLLEESCIFCPKRAREAWNVDAPFEH